MKGLRLLLALPFCLFTMVLASCGYHVASTTDVLPKNVKTIAIPAFGNITTRYKISDLLAAAITREFISRTRYQIVSDPDQADAVLTGDRELLEYAFYNLLTNAIKYSPSKTAVTVFGGREGERYQISVEDQGIGMDQKEVRKIFQKFYRTRKAEQSGEAGTGIGLSIVEQIVLRHGGKIEVTSALGKGSCFTLILPVGQAVESKPLSAN